MTDLLAALGAAVERARADLRAGIRPTEPPPPLCEAGCDRVPGVDPWRLAQSA